MLKIKSEKPVGSGPHGGANLKVFGVGGAGGNAINSMITTGDCQGISFVAANTDAQALEHSQAPSKLQLGGKITKGLGAGADPDVGRRSAEEDLEAIKEEIGSADILFLAAGLGGGTGSGALPVIARAARELGILSVAIVTKPFLFEGKRRAQHALDAIEIIKDAADTMIVIPNEKLLEVAEPNISMLDAFALSNSILKQAVKGISDIIQKPGLINVDFADVKSIMKEMGTAIMGTGRCSGENRAKNAALQAINSPLLENISIEGAEGVLLNITGNESVGLQEINDAAQVIYNLVGVHANIILGTVIDQNLNDEIMVTVIATGLGKTLTPQEKVEATAKAETTLHPAKITTDIPEKAPAVEAKPQTTYTAQPEGNLIERDATGNAYSTDELDTPACMRRKSVDIDAAPHTTQKEKTIE